VSEERGASGVLGDGYVGVVRSALGQGRRICPAAAPRPSGSRGECEPAGVAGGQGYAHLVHAQTYEHARMISLGCGRHRRDCCRGEEYHVQQGPGQDGRA
jgi:hypothetical protein